MGAPNLHPGDNKRGADIYGEFQFAAAVKTHSRKGDCRLLKAIWQRSLGTIRKFLMQ